MSEREEEFRKTIREVFPEHITIDEKRYQLHVSMLAVGAYCIDYPEVDRHGMHHWASPLVRTQCDAALECADRAMKQLKAAIEKDSEARMTKKIINKLTTEEYALIKKHILSTEPI
jgi:hypothetical protein